MLSFLYFDPSRPLKPMYKQKVGVSVNIKKEGTASGKSRFALNLPLLAAADYGTSCSCQWHIT